MTTQAYCLPLQLVASPLNLLFSFCSLAKFNGPDDWHFFPVVHFSVPTAAHNVRVDEWNLAVVGFDYVAMSFFGYLNGVTATVTGECTSRTYKRIN